MAAAWNGSGTLDEPVASFGNRAARPRAASFGNRAHAVSFEDAWPQVRPVITAFCRHVANNPADAQDLYQVIIIRAWRGHVNFRGESSYLTWAMRIAEREAIRMAARRERILRHEVAVDPLAAGEWLSEEPARETADWVLPGARAGWLAEAVRQAERLGVLSGTEAQVVAERLADRDASWQSIGALLGLTATACAVAHCRAVPKLRVFLFTHHGEALGGRSAIEAAFERAARDLTEAEAEAFKYLVLDRRTDYRRRGWQAALRGACAKVAPNLAAG